MVTLVIREVVLEQVESLVDGLGQPEFPHEEWNGADAPAGDSLGLGGGVVVDVRGGEDRIRRGCSDGSIEPLADFALAGGMMSVWNRLHSKSPCGLGHGICKVDPMCRKHREISSFSSPITQFGPRTTLG